MHSLIVTSHHWHRDIVVFYFLSPNR